MDEKPSRNEDEFFHKRDAELIAQKRAELDAKRKNAERASHYMKCPKCGGDLVEREYHRIKMDVCPDCHGTWLDAGELEMLSRVDHSRLGAVVRSMFGLKQ